MVHKIAITVALTSLFVVGAIFTFIYDYSPAKASITDNIFGWAWSSNIGWISFNDANSGSGGGVYGVRADGIGNLSGFAWSPNIGWISFNAPDVAGCPGTAGNPGCSPKLNLSTHEISGFARACAGTVSADCGGASRSDGWDGWISLRGTSPAYGVTTTASSPYYWNGWAWGGEVVGWISFSGITSGGSGMGYGVFGPSSGGSGPLGPSPFVIASNGSPNPSEVGKPVTWSALVSGGNPPYSYSWGGTDGLSGGSLSIQKIYLTVGVKTGTVTVTDSSVPARTASASFDVSIIPKKKIGGIIEIQPE